MLRKLRITVAVVCVVLISLLFCDFTGTLPKIAAPLVKIQLIPAILAGSFIIIGTLALAAILFGRLYCSTVCPMGVYQDLVSKIASRWKKNRFSWHPGKTFWRIGFCLLFVALAFGGFLSTASLLDPYGAFGRIASNILAPIYRLGNNALANVAERYDSFIFYTTDVWIKSGATLSVAIATLIIVTFFAWRFGRLWCNTVCPVGTILGLLAKFAIFRPKIDTSKCNGCGLCAKNCKASCINPAEHSIDMSRCVVCFDCLEKCPQKAFSYSLTGKRISVDMPNSDTATAPQSAIQTNKKKSSDSFKMDSPTLRRGFLSFVTLSILTKTVFAQEKPKKKSKQFDGGLAPLVQRTLPTRTVSPLPAGSIGVQEFALRCTACQLCVSVCPNQVLRPSTDLKTFMQPVMSFERGYCRPECVRCSEVCPAGAILPMTTAEKSSTQIGYAIWVRDACIVITDGVECGNCERHCPTDAIELVPMDAKNPKSLKIPTVNIDRCIGCGQCEHLCPSRPLSAIYVEGVDRQHTI